MKQIPKTSRLDILKVSTNECAQNPWQKLNYCSNFIQNLTTNATKYWNYCSPMKDKQTNK